MKVQHIIGADLSKESIDLFFHQLRTHLKIENSLKGFRQMLKWLREDSSFPNYVSDGTYRTVLLPNGSFFA